MTDPGKKIYALQFARGLAAILVAFAHAIDSSGNFGRAWFTKLWHFENFGAIGVDIFFVISGAIMIIISSKTKISSGQFIFKRCIRILPLYWVISALCIGLSFWGEWPPVKGAQVLQTLTLIPFFKPGYEAGHILFLGWTLSFEFYFYLLFSLSLLINRNNPFPALVMLLLALVIAGYVLPGLNDERFRFFTNPVMLEFLAGCCGGYLYQSKLRLANWVAYGLVVCGVAMMGWSIFSGFGNISEMGFTWDGSLSMQRVIKWGVPSFLLIAGMLFLEKSHSFPVNQFWTLAGDISYATYLSLTLSLFVLTAGWHHLIGLRLPDLFILASLVLCQVIAYFIYRIFEIPVLSFLNNALFGHSFKKNN